MLSIFEFEASINLRCADCGAWVRMAGRDGVWIGSQSGTLSSSGVSVQAFLHSPTAWLLVTVGDDGFFFCPASLSGVDKPLALTGHIAAVCDAYLGGARGVSISNLLHKRPKCGPVVAVSSHPATEIEIDVPGCKCDQDPAAAVACGPVVVEYPGPKGKADPFALLSRERCELCGVPLVGMRRDISTADGRTLAVCGARHHEDGPGSPFSLLLHALSDEQRA